MPKGALYDEDDFDDGYDLSDDEYEDELVRPKAPAPKPAGSKLAQSLAEPKTVPGALLRHARALY